MVAHWAAAVLYNGLGRYEEAAAAAREVVTNGILPWLSMWARFELVEAAARVGDTELARDALDAARGDHAACRQRLRARHRGAFSGAARRRRCCRGVVSRGDRAARAGRGSRPELARAHLLFGEWLRREGRLGEARERLRTAEEMFAEIGMEAFAERARGELVAAGAKLRKRPLEPREELTPQEEQIARLARDGLTNAEIGAQLFLSPRTVEWHLHKVFAKLGIDSRSGLDAALPPSEREAGM